MSIGKELFGGGNGLPMKSAFGKVRFEMFFDRAKVTSALDKKEQRVLGGTGAFGRGVMRRVIRPGGKKGKSAAPGNPPRYHTRGFASLKDGIFFSADLEQGTVIIGPNKLKTPVDPHNKASGAQLLEEGGTGTIVSYRHNKTTGRGTRKIRTGRWHAHPYAKRALEPTQLRMAELIATIPI